MGNPGEWRLVCAKSFVKYLKLRRKWVLLCNDKFLTSAAILCHVAGLLLIIATTSKEEFLYELRISIEPRPKKISFAVVKCIYVAGWRHIYIHI